MIDAGSPSTDWRTRRLAKSSLTATCICVHNRLCICVCMRGLSASSTVPYSHMAESFVPSGRLVCNQILLIVFVDQIFFQVTFSLSFFYIFTCETSCLLSLRIAFLYNHSCPEIEKQLMSRKTQQYVSAFFLHCWFITKLIYILEHFYKIHKTAPFCETSWFTQRWRLMFHMPRGSPKKRTCSTDYTYIRYVTLLLKLYTTVTV